MTQEEKIRKAVDHSIQKVIDRVVRNVSFELLTDYEREIVFSLKFGSMTTAQIAEIVNRPSKSVAAKMIALSKKLSYIEQESDEKGNKTWWIKPI